MTVRPVREDYKVVFWPHVGYSKYEWYLYLADHAVPDRNPYPLQGGAIEIGFCYTKWGGTFAARRVAKKLLKSARNPGPTVVTFSLPVLSPSEQKEMRKQLQKQLESLKEDS